jgi:hypothetical protein
MDQREVLRLSIDANRALMLAIHTTGFHDQFTAAYLASCKASEGLMSMWLKEEGFTPSEIPQRQEQEQRQEQRQEPQGQTSDWPKRIHQAAHSAVDKVTQPQGQRPALAVAGADNKG